jgi:hypothetical protein
VETFESRRRSSTWSAGLRARAPKKLSCKPCRTIATTFVAPHLAACSNQSSARSLQGVSHAVPSSKLLSPATRAGGGGGGAGSAFGGGGHGAVGGCGTAGSAKDEVTTERAASPQTEMVLTERILITLQWGGKH